MRLAKISLLAILVMAGYPGCAARRVTSEPQHEVVIDSPVTPQTRQEFRTRSGSPDPDYLPPTSILPPARPPEPPPVPPAVGVSRIKSVGLLRIHSGGPPSTGVNGGSAADLRHSHRPVSQSASTCSPGDHCASDPAAVGHCGEGCNQAASRSCLKTMLQRIRSHRCPLLSGGGRAAPCVEESCSLRPECSASQQVLDLGCSPPGCGFVTGGTPTRCGDQSQPTLGGHSGVTEEEFRRPVNKPCLADSLQEPLTEGHDVSIPDSLHDAVEDLAPPTSMPVDPPQWQPGAVVPPEPFLPEESSSDDSTSSRLQVPFETNPVPTSDSDLLTPQPYRESRLPQIVPRRSL